ncbi:hypothetical protein IY145_20835 [Methylosinus sp. H3A]|uniref:hypothetical protein n=1 Tax=Methylosinus sp. H3A TaxID=2785786 RepID=UPI0018C1DEE8|nr:hypothetical protein [Methylosinus sp. H3A]MBG0811798.1 hypothetical protein [Methylosinus sp. H3A]
MTERVIARDPGGVPSPPRSACAAIVASLCMLTTAVAAPQPAPSSDRPPHVAARRAPRAPAPPRRPPEQRAPQPAEAPPAAPPELPPLDTSAPPPSLPRAPRERMRQCAMQWMKIKQEGRVGGTSWREFATRCLTR